MAGYSTPAWANGTSPAVSAENLLALGQAVELSQHPYGVCSTAAATAAKTVTLDYSGTLSLFTGLCIRVKFANSNSASNPTLNVNSTGAIPIRAYGTISAATWLAGQVISFVYDGTNWLYDGIAAYTQGQTLSAATAQAIGEFAGVTPATPDAAFAALASSCAKIVSGTYTGTGVYGQSNPNSLTFPFNPYIVAIYGENPSGILLPPSPPYASGTFGGWSDSMIWMRNAERVICWLYAATKGSYYVTQQVTSLNAKTLSWYINSMPYGISDGGLQLNQNGAVYQYIAIGF